MRHSNSSDTENKTLKEFCDFVESTPIAPSSKTERRVIQNIEAELHPTKRLVFGKFFSIEAVTGVATLFICPQFELGFGSHNKLIHTLHETLNPFSFYLVCGFIFVVLGAVLGGIFLNRDEIRLIKKSINIYYLLYALTACYIFTLFGAVVILSSLFAWIFGAFIGNTLGFNLALWMRFSLETK